MILNVRSVQPRSLPNAGLGDTYFNMTPPPQESIYDTCSSWWNWVTVPGCAAFSPSEWKAMKPQVVATAPPPPGWFNTGPNGAPPPDVANAQITDLVNQQLGGQKVLNAGNVQTTPLWELQGAAGQVGAGVSDALSGISTYAPWIAIGVLGLLLVSRR